MEPTARKRLGRPPSPPDEVRGNRVVTFVTDDEFKELQARAEQAQTSLSRHVHDLLLTGMQHREHRK